MKTLVGPGAIPGLIHHEAGLGENVLAAGHLRQGKQPTMLAMITGAGLVEILRPRRSKLLPRHFVVAVTETRVVAFKAWGGSSEDSSDYTLNVRRDVAAEFPRAAVRADATALYVGTERVAVFCPNITNGRPDSDTEHLLAFLGAVNAGPEVKSAA